MLIWFSCTQQETADPETPDTVRMVVKQAGYDTLAAEPGIDAQPNPEGGANLIQLMWYSHPQQQDIDHFNIYRSEDEAGQINYLKHFVKALDQPFIEDTVYYDDKAQVNQKYYYYVTAVNQDGIESAPSDTVWYQLMEAAILIKPEDNKELKQAPINFTWGVTEIPHQYILRIEQFISETFHPLVYVKIVDSNYGTPQTFSPGSAWPIESVSDNGIYRWRIDCIGQDGLHIGSESNWQFFKLNIDWSSE